MNANLIVNETAAPVPVPVLLSVAALSRKLDVSETPVAAAIADGRLHPDAVLLRGARAGTSPLFDLNRLAEIREALAR